MSSERKLLLWAEPHQDELVEHAIKASGMTLGGVGSDVSSVAADLSNRWQCSRIDDLRHVVNREDAAMIWIASSDPLDPAMLKALLQSDRTAACSAPQPAAVSELGATADELRRVHFLPLMRRSPGFRSAIEALPDFGDVHCVNVSFRSGPGEGSLFARLFDGADVITYLCGEAELLDAAHAGSAGEISESLAALRGHMTMNLRFPEKRCACIAISDRAGQWFRGVTVLGEGGSLRISDDSFEWRSSAGELIDQHTEQRPCRYGELCGMQLQRIVDRRDENEAPPDCTKLLALCEAARLSARTGQCETPRKVLQILSRP